eukprot:236775_1
MYLMTVIHSRFCSDYDVNFLRVDGYASDFEPSTSSRPKDDELAEKPPVGGFFRTEKKVDRLNYSKATSEYSRIHSGQTFRSLNAWERHQKYIRDYVKFYGDQTETKTAEPGVSEADILADHYRLIRTDEDNDNSTWEKRIAKKYYDRLFREYGLVDMSRYKEGKFGIRWRMESEVMDGKGQFSCGHKKCSSRKHLRSFEMPFSYMEQGDQKHALIKLRLCPKCAYKLHYKKSKEKERAQLKKRKKEKKKRKEKKSKKRRKKKRKMQSSEDSSSSTESDSDEVSNRESASKKPGEAPDDIFKGMFL